jgi:hypothetical protein
VNGYIVEYVHHGWPTIDIQVDAKHPSFEKDQDVLSIWHFESEDERDFILRDLRKFREQQKKGLA